MKSKYDEIVYENGFKFINIFLKNDGNLQIWWIPVIYP